MSVERTKQNSEKGVTLIELVVTLIVLAIIAGFLGRPLISLVETKLLINEQTDQQADIEYALSRISYEVRFGPEVQDCPTDSGGIKIESKQGLKEYKYNGTDLVVETKAPAKTEILVPDIDGFDCVTRYGNPPNPYGPPNLYELTLVSGREPYVVRALQRQ